MSPDERLQELARAAGEGDLEAEARLLGERLRRGELEPERVGLAARLGRESAGSLFPELEPWPETPLPGYRWWAQELLEHGDLQVRHRALFSLIWTGAPSVLLSGSKIAQRRLEAFAELAAGPGSETAIDTQGARWRLDTPKLATSQAVEVLRLASQFLASPSPVGVPIDPVRSGDVLNAAARATSRGQVLRRLRADLLSWALGFADPARERPDPLARLEELTRRAATEGPCAELLVLRARFGDLRSDPLAVAVALGDPTAEEASARLELADVGSANLDLQAILTRAATLSSTPGSAKESVPIRKRLLMGVAAAAAHAVRSGWESRHPGDATYDQLLVALDRWLERPVSKHARALSSLAERAYDHAEPPWAAYRAAAIERTRSPAQAANCALSALRWATAQRVVESHGTFDLGLARKLERGHLGSADEAPLLETAEGRSLLVEVGAALVRQALVPSTRELRELLSSYTQSPAAEGAGASSAKAHAEAADVPPPAWELPATSPAWEAYSALAPAAACDELLRRVKARELTRAQLRLALLFEHAPARDALERLGATLLDPQHLGAGPWAEDVWKQGGTEAWARVVLAALTTLPDTPFLDPLRGALARWILDARHMSLDDVHGVAKGERRHFERARQRAEQLDGHPSDQDQLRGAWASAVLSVRSRRTKAVTLSGPLVRSRRALSRLQPWALGLQEGLSLEPAPTADLRAYRRTDRFAEGEWLAHPSLGRGRVVSATPRHVEVAFADGTQRKLVHRH